MLLSFAKHGSTGLHKAVFGVGRGSVSDPGPGKLRPPEPGARAGQSRVHLLPVSEMHGARDDEVCPLPHRVLATLLAQPCRGHLWQTYLLVSVGGA